MLVSKRRRIVICLPLVGLFAALFWYLLPPKEPVYEGKSLTLWLKELSEQNLPAGSDQEQALRASKAAKARQAVQQIGTNAIPQLLKMLRSCRPESKVRQYTESLLERQHLIDVQLPAHEDLSWLTPSGFEVLGPAGVPAIPELCRLLANSYTSLQSANCLRQIGAAAVPALATVVTNMDRNISLPALLLLGDFGTASQSTIPLLKGLAGNPTHPAAGPALRVLSRVVERPSTFLPLFVERLNQTNLAADAAFALAGAGWEGVPPLLDGLTNAEVQIRAAALSGLWFSFRGSIINRDPAKCHFSNENVRFDKHATATRTALQTRSAILHLPLVLKDALDCTNTAIRVQAVHLLAGSGLLGVPTLSRAATDADPQVSAAAEQVIAGLGVEVRDGAVIRGPRDRKRLALVFTAHEFAEGGETILDELDRHKAKASFFLTGDFLRNPMFGSLLERLKRSRHQVGPHSDKHLLYCSWDQDRKTLVSREQFLTDYDKNNTVLQQSGFGFSPYLLPPYEHYNQQIADWAQNDAMLMLVNFTTGTRSTADYTGEATTNFVSSQEIFESIVSRERQDPNGLNGFILLLHLGAGPDRTDKFHTRFGELLNYIAGKGYVFVTVDELLHPPVQ